MRRPARPRVLLAGALLLPSVVNDVTKLNPIPVREVLQPRSIEEIVEAVQSHLGPISIGGGRYSMGGQTATERALQLDMRRFDEVVAFSPESKEITVQTGTTWRKIQEFLEPHGLSLQIMQTYANFTVGGSLSVNVHGRYMGQGPLVTSVKSIRVVLADGAVVKASPTENSDIFYGVIGGYGAMGVIVEATLRLTDNERVERRSTVMPLSTYGQFFRTEVRENPDVVFHNADIYPDALDTVRAVSYVRTTKAATVPDRLVPKDRTYWLNRMAYRVMSEWPGGKWWRKNVLDPYVYRNNPIEWRNYEASYDVKELEPVSRRASTYVLQEYFVPVDSLLPFCARMREILNRRKVNTINISIRHARQDPGTLLAWAKTEVFAFVLYYKQGALDGDREAVGVWTRELIDAATSFGGAYYLPYQILATKEQFHAAFPNADAFFALKKRLDPTGKFRNKLWDAYDPSSAVPSPKAAIARRVTPASPLDSEASKRIAAKLQGLDGYKRDEGQTYLTLPEWLLVFYPAEYADSLRHKPPSEFPYFKSIAQFWSYHRQATALTRGKYPFNGGYHVMVFVIGSSYTVENALKGAYEGTVGRLFEWSAGGVETQEDVLGADIAQDYVDFIRVEPWYEYSFVRALKQLWAETDLFGSHLLRKWERKCILSAEYLVKAQYAMLIKLATKAAYGDADTRMLALAENVASVALVKEPDVQVLDRFDDGSVLLSLPRYEAFRDCVVRLAARGVRFREIAGNREILLTSVVPAGQMLDLPAGRVLFEKPLIADPRSKRVGIGAPVPALHEILLRLADEGLDVEHIFDY